MKPLDESRLEGAAERVRRSHHEAIREIQDLPASSMRVIRNVLLPDGVAVQVAHRLGRRPSAAWPSFIRGGTAGGGTFDFGAETPSGAPNDTSKTLCIIATGFGAAVTVDIVVM